MRKKTYLTHLRTSSLLKIYSHRKSLVVHVNLTIVLAEGSLSGCFGPVWSSPADLSHKNDSEEVWITTGDGDRAVPLREPVGQDTGAGSAAVSEANIKR